MAILLSGLVISTAGQAADTVGSLKFARGDVSIKDAAGESRPARKGDDLMLRDLVVTGNSSIAVILLNDDSRMVLRPNTEFRVNRFEMGKDTSDRSSQNAVLNLLRGGLRLVTGLIGKANPAGYRVSTPVATIGIRGTELNTRVCGLDCAVEEKQLSGPEAAANIKEGLYVNVDDGKIFVRNFAAEQLNLDKGDSGYVSDLDSLPVQLAAVPAFQALDKLPSPSTLDMDDVEIPEIEFPTVDQAALAEAAAGIAVGAAAVGAAIVAAGGDEEEAPKTGGIDVSGTYEIDDISYGSTTALADRKWFFGANPDIEFTLIQKNNKITGEFEGDRDGTITKGIVDEDEITIDFVLEARGGEYKDGTATWKIQEDGSLKGDFNIRDQQRGVVRGRWTLVPVD